MSIYKRLSQINCNLLKKNIPKTGYNKHKKYKYYELEDMIPHANMECHQANIALVFPFCEGVAILKLVDMDDHSKYITYRLEIPELVVPEKNPNNKIIQDYGADITYLKRYLLQLAFPCFSDKDFIDGEVASSAKNTNESSAKKSESKKEPETVRELNLQELLDKALTKLQKKGLTHEEITAYAVKKQIKKVDKFNKKELNLIYDFVNKHFEKQKGGS